ncbi:hypothetical protein BSU04_37835 [Caballeronia sordidicola]|uniref:Uncharacterized protein n=1 Tax=Caballeronia sordidicola TaxID=196367 RepID=A0A226WPJ2_CABSO|nr:hypothetical protein BSU04_37835 [Caballeronia sordidicola]
MKRTGAPLIRRLKHLHQLDLGHAVLGEKKCGVPGGLKCAFLVYHRYQYP